MIEQDSLDYLALPSKLYDKIEENVADLLVPPLQSGQAGEREEN